MARGEVTGRKPPLVDRTIALAALSVAQFCAAHGISTRTYFNLRDRGLAPAEMRVGKRVLITVESAAKWRAAREGVAHAQ